MLSREGTRPTTSRAVLCAILALTAASLSLGVQRSAAAAGSAGGCEGVALSPGVDLQAAIDRSPAGTVYCFAAGEYRLLRPIHPQSGDTLWGAPGAILSGAIVLQDWTGTGDGWTTIASRQTSPQPPSGQCEQPGYEGCRYNEDLYLDGEALWQVTSLPVSPGQFLIDYETNTAYLGSDPTGHVVEESVAYAGVQGWGASDVTVRGFTVRMFANPAGHGAIETESGTGWRVEGNDVLLNHGAGINAHSSRGLIADNDVHDNGQLGLAADFTSNLVITGNRVYRNNTQGFDVNWEAGGAKFWSDTDLLIKNNSFYNNVGPGIWCDTDNRYVTISGNRVTHNSGSGIFYEISYDATITRNIVVSNGVDWHPWLVGDGIQIAESQNVEVTYNKVRHNGNGIGLIQEPRGVGRYGPLVLRNITISHNLVVAKSGFNGMALSQASQALPQPGSIKFFKNTYILGTRARFMWARTQVSPDQWRRMGHDRNSRFSRH